MVGGEPVALCRLGHVTTRRERHLAVLHVEPGVREVVEPAGVVVVEVGEDDVADRLGVDVHRGEGLGSGAKEPTLASGCVEGAEPGVDDPGAAIADDRPDEVVHRHRGIVCVAADEVLGPARVALRVLHRVDPMHRAVL